MASIAAVPVRAVAAQSRPNILWIVSEDNNPFIGAYGDKIARTPNIDALAREGVLFRHAYSAAPVCAPSRFAIITGVHPEACAPANHMRAVAKLPTGWRATPEYLRDAGYYCTNNVKTDYNCDLDPARIWNDSSPTAHWRNRASRTQPFFSVFNSMTTHESALFAQPGGATRPEDMLLPAYLPETPEIRRDYAAYYNLMTRMDAEVGARLAELAADGLADDTIVFYYSDNGGTLPRSKRHCYEEGLRVALIAYAPPKWRHLLPGRPGSEVTVPVGLIDLPPTVLALAGIDKPRHMHGTDLFSTRKGGRQLVFGMRNRMDERFDFVRTVTDGRWRYIRNYMPHLPAGQVQAFAWQAKGYQSWERSHLAGTLTPAQDRFFQPRPFEELYDLKSDPDELDNLAASPAAAARLAALRKALDRHMLGINDNGFIPEGSTLEGFDASRAAGAYPLPRIMALAARAAERDTSALPMLVGNLTDPNEVIRYWAAMGLVMLGDRSVPAAAALVAQLQTEPSPQVRTALAHAAGHAGQMQVALRTLAGMTAETEPPRIRLFALNALTGLGNAANAVLPEIRTAAKAKDQYVARAARYLELKLTGTYDPSIPLSTGEGSGA